MKIMAIVAVIQKEQNKQTFDQIFCRMKLSGCQLFKTDTQK